MVYIGDGIGDSIGDDLVRSVLYSRRASVTVVIGDGFNATAPGHSDVTVLVSNINAHH